MIYELQPCAILCKGAFSYNPRIKGKNADATKILFVANKSDSRALNPSFFDDYEITFSKSQIGKTITELLKTSNFTLDDIFFTNIFKCLLPNDRQPTLKEYQRCVKVLEQQIKEFQPNKIVIFGHQAYKHLFPREKEQINHQQMLGHIIYYASKPTLIFYHPGFKLKPSKEKIEEYNQTFKEFLSK